MDISTTTNLEEPQERQIIVKPRVMIRRSRVRLCVSKQANKDHLSTSQNHSNSPEHCIEGNYRYFFQNYQKIDVHCTSQAKSSGDTDSLFVGFEGKKIPLSSFGFYQKNNSLENSPMVQTSPIAQPKVSIAKKQDFRRLRWTSRHGRSQSASYQQNFILADDKIGPKMQRGNKSLKRELIPQTKASVNIKSKQSVAELRISGTIKDFTVREMQAKVKDSANITDFEIFDIYAFNNS